MMDLPLMIAVACAGAWIPLLLIAFLMKVTKRSPGYNIAAAVARNPDMRTLPKNKPKKRINPSEIGSPQAFHEEDEMESKGLSTIQETNMDEELHGDLVYTSNADNTAAQRRESFIDDGITPGDAKSKEGGDGDDRSVDSEGFTIVKDSGFNKKKRDTLSVSSSDSSSSDDLDDTMKKMKGIKIRETKSPEATDDEFRASIAALATSGLGTFGSPKANDNSVLIYLPDNMSVPDEGDLDFQAIVAEVKQELRVAKVKIWMPPYTIPETGESAVSDDFVEKVRQNVTGSSREVSRAIEYLRVLSFNRKLDQLRSKGVERTDFQEVSVSTDAGTLSPFSPQSQSGADPFAATPVATSTPTKPNEYAESSSDPFKVVDQPGSSNTDPFKTVESQGSTSTDPFADLNTANSSTPVDPFNPMYAQSTTPSSSDPFAVIPDEEALNDSRGESPVFHEPIFSDDSALPETPERDYSQTPAATPIDDLARGSGKYSQLRSSQIVTSQQGSSTTTYDSLQRSHEPQGEAAGVYGRRDGADEHEQTPIGRSVTDGSYEEVQFQSGDAPLTPAEGDYERRESGDTWSPEQKPSAAPDGGPNNIDGRASNDTWSPEKQSEQGGSAAADSPADVLNSLIEDLASWEDEA